MPRSTAGVRLISVIVFSIERYPHIGSEEKEWAGVEICPNKISVPFQAVQRKFARLM